MSERLQHARQKQSAIREILLRDWDPIGVTELPDWPDDEYDGYIGQIYRLLLQRRPRHELVAYLNWAVREHMALPLNIGHNEFVADKLLAINDT